MVVIFSAEYPHKLGGLDGVLFSEASVLVCGDNSTPEVW